MLPIFRSIGPKSPSQYIEPSPPWLQSVVVTQISAYEAVNIVEPQKGKRTNEIVCLDIFSVAFLLKIQSKTGQVGNPLEWLALFRTSGQENIILENCGIIAELWSGQLGINEMVVRISVSIVLCRNIKNEEEEIKA